MRRLLPLLALVGGCVAAPPPGPEPEPAVATRSQPPRGQPTYPVRRLAAPTPEAIRAYVEEVIGDRLGPATVRRANAAAGSVMAVAVPGRFQDVGPRVNVALREGAGWRGWRGGSEHALDPAAAAEIERLLALPGFWAEPDRHPEMDCPDSGATLMVVRHGGRVKITRQSCAPANLVGRLFGTVLDERVP